MKIASIVAVVSLGVMLCGCNYTSAGVGAGVSVGGGGYTGAYYGGARVDDDIGYGGGGYGYGGGGYGGGYRRGVMAQPRVVMHESIPAALKPQSRPCNLDGTPYQGPRPPAFCVDN